MILEENKGFTKMLVETKDTIEEIVSGSILAWDEYRNIMVNLGGLFSEYPEFLEQMYLQQEFRVPGNIHLQNASSEIRKKVNTVILPLMQELHKSKENAWGLRNQTELEDAYSVIAFVTARCTDALAKLPAHY